MTGRVAALLLLSAPLAAQTEPAYHVVCRQIMAGEMVSPTASMRARAGGADFFAGCTGLRNREWAQAGTSFEKAVAADSMDAVYRLWLARARGEELRRANPFRQLTLFTQVKADLNRAIALDSGLVDAHIARIEMTAMTPKAFGGDPELARTRARDLRRLSPYSGAMMTARVSAVTGDTAEAERELRAAVRTYADSVPPHVSLLALILAQQRTADAAKVIGEMKRTPSLRLIADFYTGQIAAMTGREMAAGEAALRRYVAQVRPFGFPQRAVAHWNLSRIYERRGQPTAAIAELRASLRLNPDLQVAKKDLERLEKQP